MELTSKQFNKLSSKDDLKPLEKKLVTKKDLKKDLEKFATKKDLDKFAIRAFNTFASKEDMKDAIMESEERMTKKIDRILTAVDGTTVKHQEIEAERTANIGAHDRIEEDIAKTNKRVTIVEKKLEAVHVVA